MRKHHRKSNMPFEWRISLDFGQARPRDISRVGKGAFSCRAHRLLEKIVGPWWARGACHRARIRATRWLCPPYNFRHSPVMLVMSAVVASRIADGVREKRGAGAGWVTP